MTSQFIPFLVDIGIFIVIPVSVWLLLRRTIPLAVLPIITGLILAAIGWGAEHRPTPVPLSSQVGFLGVLLLAFTAGLESRFSPALANSTLPSTTPLRVVLSALHALILPFVAGCAAAWFFFNQLPGWELENVSPVYAALAIGLCIAVSALPVLIGIVRELRPEFQPLGGAALKLAVIDDVVLWTGLALLLIVAGNQTPTAWGTPHILAIAALAGLALTGFILQKITVQLPVWLIVVLAGGFLAAGSWSTSVLGLHALLGAYFGGVLFPPALIRRLPVERIGMFSLLFLAPLFFGYSGLRIEPDALGPVALLGAVGLLIIAMASKIFAVVIYPPIAGLQKYETYAIGALLQCKGLMEIVAATILLDHGLVSPSAFAALVTLAVLSTLLTGPLFHACFRGKNYAQQAVADRG